MKTCTHKSPEPPLHRCALFPVRGIAWLFLMLILAAPLPLRPEEKKDTGKQLKTAIESVQLYSDQALILRQGEIRLEKGLNRLVLNELPPALIADSLQVALPGIEGVRIQEVRVENRYKKIFRSDEARQAEKNLRSAEFRLRALTDRYRALKKEQQFLREIRIGREPADKTKTVRRIDPDGWHQTLEFIQDSLSRNHQMVNVLLDKIDTAREELNVALAVAARYRSTTSVSTRSIFIHLVSRVEKPAKIVIRYRIRGAGWYPQYACRVFTKARSSEKKAKVRLLTYALVRNRTGEDWKNVKLNFSAANPDESATLPTLYSWKIRSRLEEKKEVAEEEGDLRPKRKRERRRIARRPEPLSETTAVTGKGGRAHYNRIDNQVVNPIQQRIMDQTDRSAGFYKKNKAVIQEKRAARKSDAMETNIRDFRSNVTSQERAFRRRRYKRALRYSEGVLDNIGRMEDRFRKLFEPEQRRAQQLRRMSLKMMEQQKLENKLVLPRLSSRGYDYRYAAGMREDVRSDGAFHKVLLLDNQLEVELNLESAPEIRKMAFLSGSIRYESDTPLLTGPLTIFHNTDYVGETRLENVSSREPFKIYLGNEPELRVERKRSEFREKTGLLSKEYVFNRTIVVSVENRKKKPVSVYIYERLPVSTDDKVRIQDVRTSVVPDKTKKESGLYRFPLNLSPGEKKEIKIQYRLIHPENVIPVYGEKSDPAW